MATESITGYKAAEKELVPQSSRSSGTQPGFALEVLDAPEDSRYVSGKKLLVIFVGLFVAVLLVTLDQTIVATALPRIVSDFNALGDITWIVTAYYLTQGGCMLIVGQILKLSRKKLVFLASITIFEIGSLICALSKSIPVLIFGRAIAGCGAAGIQISVSTIMPDITPLEKRPILFSAFGGVIGLSTVAGPLLGGAFTDDVTWQWCFWINLPCGACAVALVLFFLPNYPPAVVFSRGNMLQTYLRLDWLGMILNIGFFTCLLLPLQWGGNIKPWNSPSVIALFVVSAVLFAAFIVWERYKGEHAMIPLEVITRRTPLGAALVSFFSYVLLMVATYYLPLWYQSHGSDATRSGLNILPLLGAVIIAAGVVGGATTSTGRYWWFLLLCPLLSSIGAGLLYTVRSTTPNAHIIGFQIIFGVGVGAIFQTVLIAVQAEYADNEEMIPQATSFVSFTQILGGIVSIAIAGSVFANELRRNLPNDLPAELRSAILESVTAISVLPEPTKSTVLAAYSRSLDPVFVMGVPAGICASLAALLIVNYNIKTRSVTAVSQSA